MPRHQSAEICSNRSSGRILSSRSKHREIARDAKEDVAPHCLRVTIQFTNQLWKVQTRRTHTLSSTETSSQSTLSASVGQNSRQVLIDHHEEIFGKLHKSKGTLAVDDFDFAKKMPCARRRVTATPQRRSFASFRVALWGSPMSVGRRT